MKKSLLSLTVFLAFGLVSFAQTEKGSWLVGGNLGLNTAKNNTEISISPSAGYFFLRNFAAGVNFDYTYSKVSYSKVTQLGVGPFARYYFGTMNVRPFADAELSYESQKTKDLSSVTTVNGSSFFIGGGIAAFINRNVAVEGLAGYKNTNIQNGPNTGGFNLRIGFQVYLSREQVEKIREKRF